MAELSADFILISGSEDATLPQQVDARWRQYSDVESEMINRILGHPKLKHWYAENLDYLMHHKLSPLPLGLVFPNGCAEDLIAVPQVAALAKRPLKVLCAHRHREGPQWNTRHRVSELGKGPWAPFTSTSEGELPETEFFAQVEANSFVFCVEGGGLDPSPKAWVALLHGAIPIIRQSPIAPAYLHLPVVVIEEWCEDLLCIDRLARWRNTLQHWFDDARGRREVLYRLSLDYWWNLVSAGLPITTGRIGLCGKRAGIRVGIGQNALWSRCDSQEGA